MRKTIQIRDKEGGEDAEGGDDSLQVRTERNLVRRGDVSRFDYCRTCAYLVSAGNLKGTAFLLDNFMLS